MSSHREAPQISKDQVADSTDVYAFRSPDKPSTVTLICNYIPFQLPDAGPNFYEFGDDVVYDINIDNTGDGYPNIVYRFSFTTVNHIPQSFLYNDGPITSLTGSGAALWNRRQSYTLQRLDYTDGHPDTPQTTSLGTFPCPPCNIGPLSTPNYSALANEAIRTFSGGSFHGTVFAGQRAEGFYIDLGSIFDLAILRPFQQDHTTFGLQNTGLGKMAAAVNATSKLNVHSLALQIPIKELTRLGTEPSSPFDKGSVIGVWTSASRPAVRTYEGPGTNNGEYEVEGGLVQVSRLGNPLINEVLIPISEKDKWNASKPANDSNFAAFYANPLLADLLPVLYPGVFPHLNRYNTVNGSYSTNAHGPDRADIVAILLTGLPVGIIKGFSNHMQKGTIADMLRLNVGVKPSSKPNAYGILGGDLAGFPNGRRIRDDVTTIELRALAGATLPLVDAKYAKAGADAAAGAISQGLTNASGTEVTPSAGNRYMDAFPYLGRPWGGYYIGETPLVSP